MNSNKNFLFIALLFITLSIISIIEDNLAIVFLGSIIYITMNIVIQFLNINNRTFYIFNIFSLFYLVHLVFLYYGINILYDKSLMFPDESFFYQSSNNIINNLKNGYSILDINNIYTYHEMPAYIYISGKISILANYYGQNSIFVQKLLIIFVSASIVSVLYLILIKYLNPKTSFYSALLFGLFTHLTFLSSLLLRDVFVALTYILFFYVILDKFSIKNTFILFFTFLFSFYLRVETGLFLISLSSIYFIYLLNKSIRNKIIRKVFILIMIILTLLILYYINIYDIFIKIYTTANEHGVAITDSGSLALKLKSLPYGTGNIAMAIFSQLQPFPFWLDIEKFSILAIFSSIGGFIWFLIVLYSVYGVIRIKILRNLDIRLIYLFYSSLIYILLLSSSEGVIRRLIVVYPIIFVISVLSYTQMTLNQKRKIFYYGLSIYIGLHIIYLILKL